MDEFPILIPWSCLRTGDCCRKVDGLVMTVAEQEELLAARPEIPARWLPRPHGFVWLETRPCPYLEEPATCTVHAVRPYNCRRFGCHRASPREALLFGGPQGCVNLGVRWHHRGVRKDARKRQLKAQGWAYHHGWGPETKGPTS